MQEHSEQNGAAMIDTREAGNLEGVGTITLESCRTETSSRPLPVMRIGRSVRYRRSAAVRSILRTLIRVAARHFEAGYSTGLLMASAADQDQRRALGQPDHLGHAPRVVRASHNSGG